MTLAIETRRQASNAGVGTRRELLRKRFGDIFIAFFTANPGASSSKSVCPLTVLPNDQINPVLLARVQATEEAVINAMIAAETMTGVNGYMVIALPHDRLQETLKKYNRVAQQPELQ